MSGDDGGGSLCVRVRVRVCVSARVCVHVYVCARSDGCRGGCGRAVLMHV